MREILRWKKGKFAFKADLVQPTPELNRQSVGGLLLEAMRLEDEARALKRFPPVGAAHLNSVMSTGLPSGRRPARRQRSSFEMGAGSFGRGVTS